jgi:N-methylhydantoinase B/oxoprolinase/acetone carboxylase alpha subunit
MTAEEFWPIWTQGIGSIAPTVSVSKATMFEFSNAHASHVTASQNKLIGDMANEIHMNERSHESDKYTISDLRNLVASLTKERDELRAGKLTSTVANFPNDNLKTVHERAMEAEARVESLEKALRDVEALTVYSRLKEYGPSYIQSRIGKIGEIARKALQDKV